MKERVEYMTIMNSNDPNRCTVFPWQCLALCVFLFVSSSAWAQDPAKVPYVRELEEYSNAPKARRSEDYRDTVRKRFPLEDQKVSDWLSRIVVGPMNGPERNGLTVILYSHGAEGLVWALNQLANPRTDTIWARVNLCWALRDHDYREAYILQIGLLKDKRDEPVLPPVKRIGYEGPDPKATPMRVCDRALNVFCARRWWEEVPVDWLANMGVTYPMAVPERDKSIALLSDWWSKFGELFVTLKKPSAVEEIIKQPLKEAEAIKEKNGQKE
ncbi:MAG: hypothetical protein AB1696_23625 [Planctomycetota bacterium]